MLYLIIFQIIWIILKLCGVLSISWWLVLAPVMGVCVELIFYSFWHGIKTIIIHYYKEEKKFNSRSGK